MSAPLRELLTSASEPPGGWVDFDLFVEANVLADRMFGHGDLALVWEMGRFAATHNMGVWRGIVMRHVRPAMFLGIASGLWGSHYEGGKLRSRTHGDDALILEHQPIFRPRTAHIAWPSRVGSRAPWRWGRAAT